MLSQMEQIQADFLKCRQGVDIHLVRHLDMSHPSPHVPHAKETEWSSPFSMVAVLFRGNNGSQAHPNRPAANYKATVSFRRRFNRRTYIDVGTS